jgi:protein-S-isoprenylcysteine O-methyltransferase Ste14
LGFRNNTVAMSVASDSKDGRRRVFAVLGTVAFLALAPGTVVGYIPWLISRWHVHAPFPGFMVLRVVGVVLIVAGIPVLLECFARFSLQGIGTPAPVFPTEHLVVKGFYRFVRNPMYVAVLTVILGQALFLGSAGIAVYAGVVWLAVHLFVTGYEEPTLLKSFGAEYEAYRAHVPRWIPQLRPWQGLR